MTKAVMRIDAPLVAAPDSTALRRSAATDAAASAPRQSAAADASTHFAGIPITEHTAFPPPDDASGCCWIYLTLNAEIALALPRHAELQRIVDSPRARISVDGQWLWWALRRKYPALALRKLAGSDLVFELARHCQQQGRRLLLLGSSAGRNARAVARLRRAHPELAVAGYAPPWYAPGTPEEAAVEAQALAAVQAWQPHYVVLGLGVPKQDRLAWRLRQVLDGTVAGVLCFGGAIDFASGDVRRAPRWLQRCGLEGLWRVLQQPSRLGRLFNVLRVLPMLASGRY